MGRISNVSLYFVLVLILAVSCIISSWNMNAYGDITPLSPAPPAVQSTVPIASEQNVALGISIEVVFSEPMNTSTVQGAFSISPSVLGDFSWQGSKMIFNPTGSLAASTLYQVTVSALALDLEDESLDGNANGVEEGSPADDFQWGFTTQSSPPRVSSVSPVNGETNVFTDENIVITFDKGMKQSDTVNAISLTVDTIQSPISTSGTSLWSNGDRTLTFTPSMKFQHDKLYTVTVDHSAADANGAKLDGDQDGVGGEEGQDDYIWTFRTIPEPPKVISTTPKKTELDVDINIIISIKFSKDMDRTSVEDAFSITNEENQDVTFASDTNVTWTSDSKVEFEPKSPLDYETLYTVLISATASDLTGITLDGDRDKKPEGVDIDSVAWSFTTQNEPPKIVSKDPTQGQNDVPVSTEIIIVFDRSMNKRNTEKAFSYTYLGTTEEYDATNGLVTWSNQDKTFTFKPDSELEENKVYTISVDETATDTDNNKFLGHSYSFTTKVNEEPVLSAGGVHPEKGDASQSFTFSVIYSDADGDIPKSLNLIIDSISWRMYESDPKDEDYIAGKAYEFAIDLDAGDYKFYFEVETEKHTTRFPSGSATRSLKVEEVQKEKVFGVFEEEYAGISTIICLPLGSVIIAVIVVLILVMTGRSRARRRVDAAARSFETQPAPMTFAPDSGGDFMSFEPEGEMMSFQAFDEAPAPESAAPVVIKCPECQEHLRVRAPHRPFMFPCKCGAKLVLR